MSEKTVILLLMVIVLVLWIRRPESYQFPPELKGDKEIPRTKPQSGNWWDDREKSLEQETREHWKVIHPGFNSSLVRSWKLDGHNYLTAAKWISEGVLPTESELVSWISREKAQETNPWKNFSGYEFNNPEWVINQYGSIEPLRREWRSKRWTR